MSLNSCDFLTSFFSVYFCLFLISFFLVALIQPFYEFDITYYYPLISLQSNSLTDHRCGYLSLIPNLLSGFGWNPGKRLYKWFGDQLRDRTGNADITFRQVCIMILFYEI